ncbi:MAG TPA: cytochrome c biogenesis protein CcdA [Rickettsiales bacterium]|nr:cytochrome c biogenesis protein CcdA [Rickettsiales bacterium]
MSNIFLCFLAGFFLNFMPCILPILSLKIYNIVKYSQTEKNKHNLRLISFATSFGIVFIFTIFGIIEIIFKYTGQNFHLGFHFQNTYFLIIIVFALFLFFLNSLNFFHIDYPPRIINFLQNRYEHAKKLKISLFIENFITGIFLVLFSLPCCMPIFGSIATLALLSTNYIGILICFIATALGMALPFLIIQFKPNLLDFLKNKKYLLKLASWLISISIFGTIIWLLYVLFKEIGLKPLIILMLFFVSIPVQFKILKKPLHVLVLIIFTCISGTILPVSFYKERKALEINSMLWKNDINIENIDSLVKDNKTVFISISASWCIICNLNEIVISSSYNITNFLNNPNIITYKIDVTKDSKKADYFFGNNENFGVPTYIIYNKTCPNGYSFTGKLNEKRFFMEFKKCDI